MIVGFSIVICSAVVRKTCYDTTYPRMGSVVGYTALMSLANGLKKAGITVDRKVLSDLAIREPAAFQAIVDQAKAALPVAA